MSASTDQQVRELAKKVRELWLLRSDDEAATLITQAIAVETAVLRDALLRFVTFHSGHVLPTGLQETMKEAQAILSAQPSPGAKAEDTASAEVTVRELFKLAGVPVPDGVPIQIGTDGDDWDIGYWFQDTFWLLHPGNETDGPEWCPDHIGSWWVGEHGVHISDLPAKDALPLIRPFVRAIYLRTKEQP